MSKEKIFASIIKALENVFIYVDIEDCADIELNEYIINSIQFMSFIVELENELNIEFPPELLLIENFSDINKIVEIIMEIKANV